LAEKGLAIGVREAEGELVVAFAADNELPTPKWLKEMVKPFQENAELIGAFPFPKVNSEDPSINRYYCHIKTDPLTYFVFDSFGNRLRSYEPILSRDNYDVFIFPSNNCPLVALAQGFIFKKEFCPDSIELDDVAPFCDMVSKGYKLALVRSTGIYHHHLESVSSFIRKYTLRAIARLNRSATRAGLINEKRKRRMLLWLLYSFFWISPLIDSVKGYKEEPDIAWFYHPLACFIFTMINIIVGLKDIKRTLAYLRE
jgi:hypothetical protein